MQERQIQFDPRLTPNFFKLPEKNQLTAQLNFPLPESIANLSDFLNENNPEGIQFKQGAHKLINNLKTWVSLNWQDDEIAPQENNQQKLSPIKPKLQQTLNNFAQLFNYNGNNSERNKELFMLFKKGVEELAIIHHFLKDNNISLNTKKYIIYELINDLANTPKDAESHLAFALQELECGFPLPKTTEKLNAFLSQSTGKEFYTSVKKLAEELKTWIATAWNDNEEIQVEIYSDENNVRLQTVNALTHLQTCINSFITQFHNFAGSAPFPLYHEGIPLLAKITKLIHSESIPLDTKKNIMRTLINDMSVCAPGIHTNITNAYLQLSENISTKLMGVRRLIANTVCLELINNLRKNGEFNDYSIDMETHYVNSILNHFAKPLAIEKIEDAYATTIPETEEDAAANWAAANIRLPLFKIATQFPDAIKKALTPERVIDFFLDQSEIIQTIQTWETYSLNKVELIKNKLESYGPDSFEFMIDTIWYWDDEANNQLGDYKLKSIVELEYSFRLMLLHRLANNGFLDLTSQKERKINNISYFDFPQADIKLSYVVFTNAANEQERKPLVLHIVDEFKQNGDISILEHYLTDDTYSSIINELMKVLRHEPSQETQMAFIEKLFKTKMADRIFIIEAVTHLDYANFLFTLKCVNEKVIEDEINTIDIITLWKQLHIDLNNKTNTALFEKLINPLLKRIENNDELFNQTLRTSTRNQNTLLHIAAAFNRVSLIEKIMAADVQLHTNNAHDQSPLDIAAINHAWASASYLLDTNLNFNFMTALLLSAQENQVEILKKIHEKFYTDQISKELISTQEELNELLAHDTKYFIQSILLILLPFHQQKKTPNNSRKNALRALTQLIINCPDDIANKILNLKGKNQTLLMLFARFEDTALISAALRKANVTTINNSLKLESNNKSFLGYAFAKMNHETAHLLIQKTCHDVTFTKEINSQMLASIKPDFEKYPLLLSLLDNDDPRILDIVGSSISRVKISSNIQFFSEKIITAVFNKPNPYVWLETILKFSKIGATQNIWQQLPSKSLKKEQLSNVLQMIFNKITTPADNILWFTNGSGIGFITAVMQVDAVDITLRAINNGIFETRLTAALQAAYKYKAWNCLSVLLASHREKHRPIKSETMLELIRTALEANQWDIASEALTLLEINNPHKSSDYQLPQPTEALTIIEEKMTHAFFKALVMCSNNINLNEDLWSKQFNRIPSKIIDQLLLATTHANIPLLYNYQSINLLFPLLQKASVETLNKLFLLPTPGDPMLQHIFTYYENSPNAALDLLEKINSSVIVNNFQKINSKKYRQDFLNSDTLKEPAIFTTLIEKAPFYFINSKLYSECLNVFRTYPEHSEYLEKIHLFINKPEIGIEKKSAEFIGFLLRSIPENSIKITDHNEWLTILNKASKQLNKLKKQFPNQELYFEILNNQLLALSARIYFSYSQSATTAIQSKRYSQKADAAWEAITNIQDMLECDRLLRSEALWHNPNTTYQQKVNYLLQLRDLISQGNIRATEQLQTRLISIIDATNSDEQAPTADDPKLFDYAIAKLISSESKKKWDQDLQNLCSQSTLFSQKHRNNAMTILHSQLAQNNKTPEEKFKLISDALEHPAIQKDKQSSEILINLQKDLVLSSFKPK